MRKELEKNYNPNIVEDKIYANWLEKKYFHAEIDKTKTPYTIVIPPPNITGQLHIGHAFNCSLQDILIRWKRMQGFNALWVPGTDHASISTEVKIVEDMATEGLTKDGIGREAFLERAWKWREKYGGRIIEQFKKMGFSCDWDRERFTMDDGLSGAVVEVFNRLYEKGLIYRGERLINWCSKCRTTISDAEVDHEDTEGNFWYFKYPIKGTDEFLQFATTRPETMLGDTAIAVNPDDERYKHLVGKTVTVPIVNREIPIIADKYVEADFGTGVVKITPGHDPNDFEVGARHSLPIINIMNDDGTINENGGSYKGLHKTDARKKIVEEFTDLGLFIKKESIKHSVGVHERCGEIVEPLIKLQWFVKMEGLAKPAVDVLKNGELKLYPERFGKVYLNWMENIRDWCISRQLWWGHRIPAYYCRDCGEVTVARTAPDCCVKCGGKNVYQDEDTLDTWFSSALWPFSTLGWPDKTPELEHFYPTNVLVTAPDIIFFWVARMVFSGLEQMNELPFSDVLFNGLIRDSQGRKMSKSLGNGIDPLELVEQFGADALRLTLVTGNSMGSDSRFHMEKIEASRNFLNKIWNATRFILMNFDETDPAAEITDLTAADKWILSKVNTLAKEVTENMDDYELGLAVSKIYDFIWDEYCDWYIEMVKPRLYNKEDNTRDAALWTLRTVLISALKLLHPFMPFITEEIFTSVQSDEETIMLSKWVEFEEKYNFKAEENQIELIKEAVKGIRNARTQMNVAPSRKSKIFVVSNSEATRNIFESGRDYVKSLGYGAEISIQPDKAGIDDDAVCVVVSSCEIYMPFADLVDISKEIERLEKEKQRLSKEVERVESKLANAGFIAKAPENVLAEEREKAAKYKEMLAKVEEQLKRFS